MTKIGHNQWLTINHSTGLSSNLVNELDIAFALNGVVKTMRFDDAADYTADLISKNYNNLHLSLSGGLDSEFVGKVLVRNQINFTPVILETPYNVAEIWYAYKFCDDNKLSPVVLNYVTDYDELIKEMIKITVELNMPMNASSLPIVVANKLSQARVVNGYGEPYYNSTSYKEAMGEILDLHDNNFWTEMHFGDKHPGAFFTYTPNLFQACVREIDSSKNSQVAKSELYGIIPRPKLINWPFDYCNNPQLQKIITQLQKKLHKPWELQSIKIHRCELLDKLNNL